MRSYSFAVVGAGPTATYVLERFAANALKNLRFHDLTIHVFDPSGEFGAGAVHSPSQPETSPLNRIAGQITFAADETNRMTAAILPETLRPDFHHWCHAQLAVTGDARFDLAPADWPIRRLHGLALVSAFRRYADLLESLPGVSVRLHPHRVCDVERRDGRWLLRSEGGGEPIPADQVLLATGHSHNLPEPGSLGARLLAESRQWERFRYVPYPYPLERTLPRDDIPPGAVVGCAGMGLTAFDVILYLTAGRGGTFAAEGDGYRYLVSGLEPKIVAFCRSGLFTTARPHNAKEADILRFEHRPVFLGVPTIDRLRATHGIPVRLPGGAVRRQLDFERHVLPVLVLEKRCLYYRTLFGGRFGDAYEARCQPAFEDFVGRHLPCHGSSAEGIRWLEEPGEPLVWEAMQAIREANQGAPCGGIAARHPALDVAALLAAYYATVFGAECGAAVAVLASEGRPVSPALRGRVSPWGHPIAPERHRFDWETLVSPLAGRPLGDAESYRRALRAFMEWDHAQAAQDNLRNPTKAACDGVWRDLRQVLGYLVDFGGLTASSHRRFLGEYLRLHNRLANGASIDVMRKMLALQDSGVLDLSVGPEPELLLAGEQGLRVRGGLTGHEVRLDVLIDARLHTPDIRRDASPLYRNLLRRGWIRPWCNPGRGGEPDFVPGGVDITPEHAAVTAEGEVCPTLSLLGAPTEGALFYQIGAARPRCDHHILNDVIRWFDHFLAQVPLSCYERIDGPRVPVVQADPRDLCPPAPWGDESSRLERV
ncbi:MAG TPA: FAD/NAD(P)-binding protein [Longimicrobiaceae bacterium]|nr:FAD/NAD(P)-binding protein [Longimicrobiaceae bacterium]